MKPRIRDIIKIALTLKKAKSNYVSEQIANCFFCND